MLEAREFSKEFQRCLIKQKYAHQLQPKQRSAIRASSTAIKKVLNLREVTGEARKPDITPTLTLSDFIKCWKEFASRKSLSQTQEKKEHETRYIAALYWKQIAYFRTTEQTSESNLLDSITESIIGFNFLINQAMIESIIKNKRL
jgi:hypothetical protein